MSAAAPPCAVLLALLISFAPVAASAQSPADSTFVWMTIQDPQSHTYARNFPCAVYDARRSRVTAFTGGYGWTHPGGSGYGYIPGLAVFNASTLTWALLPDTNEPLLDYACAAYDSAGDAVWLFGGSHYTNTYPYGYTTEVLGDLWRLDLATQTWTKITTTGAAPSARTHASLVLDRVRRHLVLFGGDDANGTPLQDLWTMDLTNPRQWTYVSMPGGLPPARSKHFAAYDEIGDRMLVVGGMAGNTPQNSVWALSLAGTPMWTQALLAGFPGGRLIGALDRSRGRIVVAGNGDGNAYALDLQGMGWSMHFPSGGPASGTDYASVALDPSRNQLVFAWAGLSAASIGFMNPPTGILSFSPLPPVTLAATFTNATFRMGQTTLFWDVAYDHAPALPVRVEGAGANGVFADYGPIDVSTPGTAACGILSLTPGDSLDFHLKWFDGTSYQTTPDHGVRLPPAPLVLHVAPESLWFAAGDLHLQFSVPDDSARFLVDQTLERSDNGGPWNFRARGWSEDNGIWAWDEVGARPFTHYEYRLKWLGPDGQDHVSAPYGMIVPGEPLFVDTLVTPRSVEFEWSTVAGLDEAARVLVGRPPDPRVWADTVAVNTDAAGAIAFSDAALSPDENYNYRLDWFDGQAWHPTPEIVVFTGSGSDTTPPPPLSFSVGHARPDPAADFLVLPLAIPSGREARVELFDLGGRRRYDARHSSSMSMLRIDTSELESGLYLIRVESAGVVVQRRVAIVH
jgi:Galactose oxidase, central domain